MKKESLEEQYDKIDKQEEKLLEANEEVKKLIASVNKLHKVIKIGDIDVRIRAYMPRHVRMSLLKTHNALKRMDTDDSIIKADQMLYPLIAEMCLDSPFNKPATWKRIDEETGIIQSVLINMLEVVNSTDKQVESFRAEQ